MLVKNNTRSFEFNITGYEFQEINDEWDDWLRMYFLIKENGIKLAEEIDCCMLTYEAVDMLQSLKKLLNKEIKECSSDFLEPYFKMLFNRQFDSCKVKLIYNAFNTVTKELKELIVESDISYDDLSEFISEFETQVKQYPKRECIKEVQKIVYDPVVERFLLLLDEKYKRNFKYADECIVICKDSSLCLYITYLKSGKEECVEAKLLYGDEEDTFYSADYENEEQYIQEVFKCICKMAGKEVRIVAFSKKHKHFGKSFYERKNSEWVLFDEYVIKNKLINLFNFKTYIKERIYNFELTN